MIEISGRKYHQKELTLNQSNAVREILEGTDILGGAESIEDVINSLTKSGLVNKILSVVLVPEGEKQSVREVSESEIESFGEISMGDLRKVVSDFFLFNASWMSVLLNFLSPMVEGISKALTDTSEK